MTTRLLIVNEGPDKNIDVDTMGIDQSDPNEPHKICRITRVGDRQHSEFYVYDSQYLVIREAKS